MGRGPRGRLSEQPRRRPSSTRADPGRTSALAAVTPGGRLLRSPLGGRDARHSPAEHSPPPQSPRRPSRRGKLRKAGAGVDNEAGAFKEHEKKKENEKEKADATCEATSGGIRRADIKAESGDTDVEVTDLLSHMGSRVALPQKQRRPGPSPAISGKRRVRHRPAPSCSSGQTDAQKPDVTRPGRTPLRK